MKGRSPGLSASRRYFSTAAQVYSSLGARSTVRESTERDLLTRPACGRPNARTRRLNHPRHVISLHAPSRRRRACGDYATSRPSARNERQRVRCADAPTRQHGTRRIQFARALASQRPPSRERPSPGGGGAGRAPSPSLCVSPFSRSIDDTEHGRRQVRGPPACSSAGTSLSAAAAAAAATYLQRITVPVSPAAS